MIKDTGLMIRKINNMPDVFHHMRNKTNFYVFTDIGNSFIGIIDPKYMNLKQYNSDANIYISPDTKYQISKLNNKYTYFAFVKKVGLSTINSNSIIAREKGADDNLLISIFDLSKEDINYSSRFELLKLMNISYGKISLAQVYEIKIPATAPNDAILNQLLAFRKNLIIREFDGAYGASTDIFFSKKYKVYKCVVTDFYEDGEELGIVCDTLDNNFLDIKVSFGLDKKHFDDLRVNSTVEIIAIQQGNILTDTIFSKIN